MLTPNQVNTIFQSQYGRVATPQEYDQYKNAPLSTLASLNPADINATTPNVNPDMSPYDVPAVQAAGQNVGQLGTAIDVGNQELANIPTEKQANLGVGITTASQLNNAIKAEEAPISLDLRSLGKQYSAARTTYTSVLSAAKSALSQAKSQVSSAQSKALTQAGKVITLLQNGELDPTKVDLSGIESAAGLPTGFFASITPRTTTTKSNIRSLQGGLYNLDTGKWIVAPTNGSSGAVTSGGLSVSKSDIGAGATKLDDSRGSDGYANTALYTQMMNYWTTQGGLIQDFIKQYPPKNYLNPDDSTIPTIIKPYLKSTATVIFPTGTQ
ncbi:hypothetical protein M1295_01500 [Patescibacteria group bacterium]|nr:hypothetical protein [Patescibacteria group bacterium]